MEKRTKDNKYWEHVVRSNDHKAFVAQQKESSPWLEVRQFRRSEASFSGDPDDDIPLQNAAGPTDESVRNRWRPLAIDAITVHIDGKSSCVIAVPLCTQELFENKFQTEYVIGAQLVVSLLTSKKDWLGSLGLAVRNQLLPTQTTLWQQATQASVD